MKIVQYLLLVLLLWNIPMFFSSDISLGSKFSYLTYLLLIIYYFLSKKHRLLFPFLLLGLLYFIISGIVFVGDLEFYHLEFVKFFILIICGAELARNTSKIELFTVLVLGSVSIIVHAISFPNDYGRYSGFYIDPNAAGFICLIGYCLSFTIKPIYFKYFGQFVLTFAGIITFSRTFLLLWLLISIISIISNRKNVLNFGVGAIVIIMILSLASYLQLNAVRFEAFESLLGKKPSSSITAVQDEGYRLDTWAVYYNLITDHPFFGNGFKTLSGFYSYKAGVHNTFLMILGESGVITFLVFCAIYLKMLFDSVFLFKEKPWFFMLAFTLIGIMQTIHNYFENYLLVFTSIWLMIKIVETKSTIDEITLQPSKSSII